MNCLLAFLLLFVFALLLQVAHEVDKRSSSSNLTSRFHHTSVPFYEKPSSQAACN
jgi:hypothetical protein